MTNTSTLGNGIHMRIAKVELIDVALKGCEDAALHNVMHIPGSNSGSYLVATRCEFANSEIGVDIIDSIQQQGIVLFWFFNIEKEITNNATVQR